MVGDPRKRLHRLAEGDPQPLIILNERQGNFGAEQFDSGYPTEGRSAGAESLQSDRTTVPFRERGIDIPFVARVANPTFAIDLERAGAIDRFVVHLQPCADVFGYANYFRVKVAATVLWAAVVCGKLVLNSRRGTLKSRPQSALRLTSGSMCSPLTNRIVC